MTGGEGLVKKETVSLLKIVFKKKFGGLAVIERNMEVRVTKQVI